MNYGQTTTFDSNNTNNNKGHTTWKEWENFTPTHRAGLTVELELERIFLVWALLSSICFFPSILFFPPFAFILDASRKVGVLERLLQKLFDNPTLRDTAHAHHSMYSRNNNHNDAQFNWENPWKFLLNCETSANLIWKIAYKDFQIRSILAFISNQCVIWTCSKYDLMNDESHEYDLISFAFTLPLIRRMIFH